MLVKPFYLRLLGADFENGQILCKMSLMEIGFRHLPSVDRVLSVERIKQLEKDYPHDLLVNLSRNLLTPQ